MTYPAEPPPPPDGASPNGGPPQPPQGPGASYPPQPGYPPGYPPGHTPYPPQGPQPQDQPPAPPSGYAVPAPPPGYAAPGYPPAPGYAAPGYPQAPGYPPQATAGNAPPPPPPGYGPPGAVPYQGAARPASADVSSAVTWAWATFRDSPGAYIGTTVVFLAVYLAAQSASSLALQTVGGEGAGTFFAALYGIPALSAAVTAVGATVPYRAALAGARGRATFRDGFNGGRTGAYLGSVAAIYAANMAAGTLGLALGPVALLVVAVLALFTWFAPVQALDKGGALRSVGSSVAWVAGNLGQCLLLALVGVALNVGGLLTCGVGLLVTVPVTFLATVHYLKAFQGEAVHTPA